MNRWIPSTIGSVVLCLAGWVYAQPGPAASAAPGASAPRMSPGGMGPGGVGPGGGRGMMGGRFGAGTTPGWELMSPDERTAHRNAMRSVKTYEECATLRDQHHRDLQARAKERGATLPPQPRRDVCAGLKK